MRIYIFSAACIEERNTGALINNVQFPYSAGFIRATLLFSVLCFLTHPSPPFFTYFRVFLNGKNENKYFVSCFLIFKALRREHSGLCEQSNTEEDQKTGAKLLD